MVASLVAMTRYLTGSNAGQEGFISSDSSGDTHHPGEEVVGVGYNVACLPYPQGGSRGR